MKPRLDSLPLTSEDRYAWAVFLDRMRPLDIGVRRAWEMNCTLADRRDADLMLDCGAFNLSENAQLLHVKWAYQGLTVSPDCWPEKRHDISHFA